jgi:hypothetical protein
MDAFELHKFLHSQISSGQEIKSPLIRKVESVRVIPNLNSDIPSAQVTQSQSSFPWDEVIIWCVAAVLLIIVMNEIQKSQNYNNFTRRRED